MSRDDEPIELAHGSGNIFADFGRKDAALLQLRAHLAAAIIKTLDARQLTVRKAEELTRIAAADFSRIRNANLARFTVDRLMTILERLDLEVSVSVAARSDEAASAPPIAA